MPFSRSRVWIVLLLALGAGLGLAALAQSALAGAAPRPLHAPSDSAVPKSTASEVSARGRRTVRL